MFKRIYIEITNICNLHCSFCPSPKREKKSLSTTEFKEILKQAKPICEEITLHLMGEPLCHPEFEKIIELCSEQDIKVQLTTNGVLIETYQDLILRSPCIKQINFSIQSFKDNFKGSNINAYLQKILAFCLLAQNKRPELYMNLRLWNIEDDVNSDNEDIFLTLEKFFNINIKRIVKVDSIKSKKIWNNLYLHFDSRFEWPSTELPYLGDTGTCHGTIGHIGILSDGTVVPCCLDKDAKIILGNCLKQELKAILKQERVLKMQSGFKNKLLVEELCHHCSYIKRFSK